MKSKIRQRREQGAVCPVCKSPDYNYLGRANSEFTEYGKHQFSCNSCSHFWQYGYTDSTYLQLL